MERMSSNFNMEPLSAENQKISEKLWSKTGELDVGSFMKNRILP
jgi:hypothetical protein